MKCKDVQYSVFCNTEDKNNDKQFIKDLFNHFFDYGFVVSTINLNSVQIDASKNQGEHSVFSIIERPQLVNTTTNETITVLPDRIDYSIGAKLLPNNTIEWTNIDDSKKGIQYLKELLELIDRNASRLAMNINYFAENKFIAETEFTNTYYCSKKPVEKNSRIVVRHDHDGELLNVIHEVTEFRETTSINLNNYQYNFEGTVVHNDLNTYQMNMTPRFNNELIGVIFGKFVELNCEVVGGINYA